MIIYVDTTELREPVKVRECQEKALQSLQEYTLANYPDTPSKFGELLLRIPDLQRTCQVILHPSTYFLYIYIYSMCFFFSFVFVFFVNIVG